MPERLSSSGVVAGSLAKKSHAAPLIGARASAVSALALACASCTELVRSRFAIRSVNVKSPPVNAALAHRSPLIAPICAARTARLRCVAAASALARSKGRPVALGLSRPGSNIQTPESPRKMPRARSAERSLAGDVDNMKFNLATRVWKGGRGGSGVSMICEPENQYSFETECSKRDSLEKRSLEHDPAPPNRIFSK